MPLNITSNYAAHVAHRNLSKTNMEATESLSKLSSGTRVVSAKDDAASLAIGSRINAEVQALKQASVNAGQASSMLQIADGAMARTNDILTRMKTLATQASSGQLTDTERGMLDTEYQALLSEVDRIAQDTEFNGNQLVAGRASTDTSFSTVAGADNLVSVAGGFTGFEFGDSVGTSAVSVEYDSSTGVMTLKNLETGISQGININSGSAIGVNETQRIVFDELDTVVKLNTAFDKSGDILPTASFVDGTDAGAIAANSIKITNVADDAGGLRGLTGTTITIGSSAGDTAAAAELTIGGFTSTSIDLTTTGVKTATFSDGTDSFTLQFTVDTAFDNAGVQAQDNGIKLAELGSMVYGTATTSNTTDYDFRIGTGTTANVDSLTIRINSITSTALGIGTTDVGSQTTAETAIDTLNTAIDLLNTSRANIGSAQNRLEFATANLASTIENQESARSALLDLDVASEMTNFTSKQILMQAGVSMLAQANQLPQNLSQLLQG